MSKIKKKLSDQVHKLACNGLDHEEVYDMSTEQHTIYVWAIENAPIRKLREWKKEFIREQKQYEESVKEQGWKQDIKIKEQRWIKKK